MSGTLHNCATMTLDHAIRKMATELQDTSLLARISGGDLKQSTILTAFLLLKTSTGVHSDPRLTLPLIKKMN